MMREAMENARSKNNMQSIHEPVLLHEVVESLNIGKEKLNIGKNDQLSITNDQVHANASQKMFWYLDGTLGGAGHALAIAKAYRGATSARSLGIIGLDRDMQAIERARVTLKGKCHKLILECENFRN
jgi:16S rRNA C1402 N4-methylase RsmH